MKAVSKNPRILSIFKSPVREGLYLFVNKEEAFKKVPEALLTTFGRPLHVTDLLVTPKRKFARISAEELLEKIATQGFFLQMPPTDPEAIEAAGISQMHLVSFGDARGEKRDR